MKLNDRWKENLKQYRETRYKETLSSWKDEIKRLIEDVKLTGVDTIELELPTEILMDIVDWLETEGIQAGSSWSQYTGMQPIKKHVIELFNPPMITLTLRIKDD